MNGTSLGRPVFDELYRIGDANLVNVLRRLRRRVRREAKHYPQISAADVVAWIDEEIKRRKA